MYYVYKPTFSISSARRLVVRFAILNSSSVTSASEPLFMSQAPSDNTYRYAPMYWLSADYFGASGGDCFLQVGCAITENNGGSPVIPTQGSVVSVGSPLPMKDVPTNAVVPVVSQAELVAEFAIPQQASTFFSAFRVFGGTQTAFTSATTWYGHTQAAVIGNFEFAHPYLPTWFSPSVSISASGGASVGNTSRLTITAPDSLRTLTVNDFTASGGTLSNFTKVS